jgi:hypothetical protein
MPGANGPSTSNFTLPSERSTPNETGCANLTRHCPLAGGRGETKTSELSSQWVRANLEEIAAEWLVNRRVFQSPGEW